MPREEFYKELQIREKELEEEIAAIRKLLSDIYKVGEGGHTVKEPSNNSIRKYPPKGDMTWQEYWLFLVNEMGGNLKASQVADAGIVANPTVDKEKVKLSAKSKLSALATEGKIGVKRNKNKKIGNTYYSLK